MEHSNLRLSKYDSLLAIVSAAIVVHFFIFKRYEPYKPTVVLPLLVGLPMAISTIYVPHADTYTKAVAVTLPLFWVALLSSVAIYRLSPWHPLAKYPGPVFCKLSKLFYASLSLSGKQHIYIKQWHDQYGDVVRVGPNELSISNADAVNPLLGNTGVPKGTFWEGRIPEAATVKPLIAISDKTEHARRRRPWNRAFNSSSLKGYEELVIKRANQLVDSLAREGKKGSVDLTSWISYFAYDVMSDLAFGGGSDMLTNKDPSGLWHLLEAGQRISLFMSYVPWLAQLCFPLPGFASDTKAFRRYTGARAKIRIEEKSPHKDIFYHLIDEEGVEVMRPTIDEVISDGTLAIVAGSDTTASAISHLFFYLMSHPIVYKRLQDEIGELGDDLFDSTKQAQMPYLNAVINETLRLLPPVLNGPPQRKLKNENSGKMLGDIFLPGGNAAFIPTYTIQRDGKNFSPLPDSFIPERWLPVGKKETLEPKIFSNADEYIHNTNAFIPFSYGPSNCVGKNLAYMEIRMVICVMIDHLHLKFDPRYNPDQWQNDMKDFFITIKGVLPTVIDVRKPGAIIA